MTQALAEQLRPARVILFGSRARGDARSDSDYDLLVELDYEDFYACRAHVRDIVGRAMPGCEFDLLIRRPGEIEQKRDDPGYMDWEIARDGVILYPTGADSQALRPVRRPARVREGPPASVHDWLARAHEDLRIIDHTLAAGETASWSGVCFHGQQLAEKYLKVLFILRSRRPPRTHDLAELVQGLVTLGYDLPDLAAECKLLEPYAVDVRYPEHVPIPNEEMGRRGLAAARTIVEAAQRHMPV